MTAVEQLGGEQDGNDEGQLRTAVNGLAVGVAPELAVVGEPRIGPLNGPPEPVKHFETRSYDAFCVSSSLGSLIHATVGNFGGAGRLPPNLTGLAA